MKSEISATIISILNGCGVKVFPYPKGGRNDVDKPGFYWNAALNQIEHWSIICEYNAVMASTQMNVKGLINDGFQSILGFEDSDHFAKNIVNWQKHLIRHGVIK